MNKYVCIHGHFYQPPRENPWLEEIEQQSSANPYHDWNERISEECYFPNARARILNDNQKIIKIVNNYEKISFNFGPTLLSWIKIKNPELLESLIKADKESQKRFNGHGNALAQVYNHMIMPLSNTQDKYTQVYWGIRDFEYHFGRKPEGLWLSETAVDLPTLEVLSELGIRFTILAPHQAKQTRPLAGGEWSPHIMPGLPYLQRLPSGRSIVLFFYDGPVSQAVAFEKLLINGEHFANRLMGAFPEDTSTVNYLMHIATDGESYGHHHMHGDMALAYTLKELEESTEVSLSNYGQFLEIQPPEFEVEIHENSSWSCCHGIERWRSHCGCNSGGHPWHQNWRAPLRQALDWLRDTIIPHFENHMSNFVADPWAARNDYIYILLDRSKVDAILDKHLIDGGSEKQKEIILKWLELQKNALFMYTSCGWFFDELSGIETVQIMKYAGRVIQLAEELTGLSFEEEFITKLKNAPSNIPYFKDGAYIYTQLIKPNTIDLYRVSGHLAASLPFNTYTDDFEMYSYKVLLRKQRIAEAGKVKLITGELEVSSKITTENLTVWYAVLYQGDQNLVCAIKPPETALETIENALHEIFSTGEIFEVVRLFENHFGDSIFTLKDLFFDMRLQITYQILSSVKATLEDDYRELYENSSALLNFVSELNLPFPQILESALSYIILNDIIQELAKETQDLENLQRLLDQVQRFKLPIDEKMLRFKTKELMKRHADDLEEKFRDKEYVKYLIQLVAFFKKSLLEAEFWPLQNTVYFLAQKTQDDSYHYLIKRLAKELDMEV